MRDLDLFRLCVNTPFLLLCGLRELSSVCFRSRLDDFTFDGDLDLELGGSALVRPLRLDEDEFEVDDDEELLLDELELDSEEVDDEMDFDRSLIVVLFDDDGLSVSTSFSGDFVSSSESQRLYFDRSASSSSSSSSSSSIAALFEGLFPGDVESFRPPSLPFFFRPNSSYSSSECSTRRFLYSTTPRSL